VKHLESPEFELDWSDERPEPRLEPVMNLLAHDNMVPEAQELLEAMGYVDILGAVVLPNFYFKWVQGAPVPSAMVESFFPGRKWLVVHDEARGEPNVDDVVIMTVIERELVCNLPN
jgi:hypothetical protein